MALRATRGRSRRPRSCARSSRPACRDHAPARPRPQARAAAALGAGDRLARDAARGGGAGRLRTVRGLGPKFEASVLAALERMPAGRTERRRAPRAAAAARDRDRRGARRRAGERGGAGTEVQLAGSARRLADSVKDIDLVAVSEQPERRSPRALGELREIEQRRSRPAAAGATGAHPLRRRRGSAHRQAGAARQPAAALHRLGRAQRGAARSRGAARAARLRVRRARRRDRRDARPARARRRCTSCSASPTSSPSCARTAASSRRRVWTAAPGCPS